MEIISEKGQWNKIVQEFSAWDPAHEWGYFEAFRIHEKHGKAVLFYSSSEHGKVAYPFFITEIKREGSNITEKSLNSVYGYTGALIEGEENLVWEIFTKEFQFFCKENRIIEINERCHPILRNNRKLFPESSMQIKREVVALDTTKNSEEVISGYVSNDVRRMIKKSLSNNVVVKRMGIKGLSHFMSLYNQTMQRNNADEVYIFKEEFFIKLHEEFSDRFWLSLAYIGEEVVGADITIVSPSFAYFFLMGTNAQFNKLGIAQSLYFNLQKNCFEEKISSAILGGGRGTGSDDPLLKFKKSFCNKNTEEQELFHYYTGKTILSKLQ